MWMSYAAHAAVDEELAGGEDISFYTLSPDVDCPSCCGAVIRNLSGFITPSPLLPGDKVFVLSGLLGVCACKFA